MAKNVRLLIVALIYLNGIRQSFYKTDKKRKNVLILKCCCIQKTHCTESGAHLTAELIEAMQINCFAQGHNILILILIIFYLKHLYDFHQVENF